MKSSFQNIFPIKMTNNPYISASDKYHPDREFKNNQPEFDHTDDNYNFENDIFNNNSFQRIENLNNSVIIERNVPNKNFKNLPNYVKNYQSPDFNQDILRYSNEYTSNFPQNSNNIHIDNYQSKRHPIIYNQLFQHRNPFIQQREPILHQKYIPYYKNENNNIYPLYTNNFPKKQERIRDYEPIKINSNNLNYERTFNSSRVMPNNLIIKNSKYNNELNNIENASYYKRDLEHIQQDEQNRNSLFIKKKDHLFQKNKNPSSVYSFIEEKNDNIKSNVTENPSNIYEKNNHHSNFNNNNKFEKNRKIGHPLFEALVDIILIERKLEKEKEELIKMENFSIMNCFKFFDIRGVDFVSAYDFQEALVKLGINAELRDINNVIGRYCKRNTKTLE